MSTKIYNGVRFDVEDFNELVLLLTNLSLRIRPLADTLSQKYIVREAVNRIDNELVRGKIGVDDADIIREVLSDARDRQYDVFSGVKKGRDVDLNMRVEVVFYSHPKGFFGQVFSESEELFNLIFMDDRVKEYAYFNNTDKPKGLTDRQWEERERVWDEIFHNSSVPSDVGFSRVVFNGLCDLKMESIASVWDMMLPDFNKRVRRMATDLLIERKLSSMPVEKATKMSTVANLLNDIIDGEDAQLNKELADVSLSVSNMIPKEPKFPKTKLLGNRPQP